MSKELTRPLYALTSRYKRIKLQQERGLTLITDSDEEYPLADISTGAREQAFLALRIGFASITMKGHTAFLILDDAFQHSDWQRRASLVNQTLSLVRAGWQVFYFTMDDHIRDQRSSHCILKSLAKSIRGTVYWNITARDARSCDSAQSESSGTVAPRIHRRLLSHCTATPGP